MECLKSDLNICLKRSIQTYVVKSHAVTYTPIAPVDNPAEPQFNYSGHSYFYIGAGINNVDVGHWDGLWCTVMIFL